MLLFKYFMISAIYVCPMDVLENQTTEAALVKFVYFFVHLTSTVSS